MYFLDIAFELECQIYGMDKAVNTANKNMYVIKNGEIAYVHFAKGEEDSVAVADPTKEANNRLDGSALFFLPQTS